MLKENSNFAVIAGTGVAKHLDVTSERTVRTKYGQARVQVTRSGFYLVQRHGTGHKIPPHMINYRANIAALGSLGVSKVIATSAVGSLDPHLGAGEVGLVTQFLDFTKRRQDTFFDQRVHHADVTEPYSKALNAELTLTSEKMNLKTHPGLVYVCTEGPRFETAAEVRMFRTLGGDVVGMTGVPEVVLANELKMDYASVVIVTNLAAGLQPTVSHDEVLGVMEQMGAKAAELAETTISRVGRRGLD